MNQDYRRLRTSVSKINYHLIFCPHYRRKIFLINGLDERFKELVKEICYRNNFNLLAIETDKDHCHIFINVPPTVSPADAVRIIKTNTAKNLLSEFKELGQTGQLWTRSYFAATTGDVSSDIIMRYVQNQRNR